MKDVTQLPTAIFLITPLSAVEGRSAGWMCGGVKGSEIRAGGFISTSHWELLLLHKPSSTTQAEGEADSLQEALNCCAERRGWSWGLQQPPSPP